MVTSKDNTVPSALLVQNNIFTQSKYE